MGNAQDKNDWWITIIKITLFCIHSIKEWKTSSGTRKKNTSKGIILRIDVYNYCFETVVYLTRDKKTEIQKQTKKPTT